MATLDVIAPAFVEMAHRIVWCVGATTDTSVKPSTRVLHPLWEWDGDTLEGWVLTSPNSPKARHLAATPSISFTYWTSNHDTCSADCTTDWDDTVEGRAAGWDRFLNGPEPVAYDPAIIPGWDSPSSPDFGVLHLTPRHLRVMPGSYMLAGEGELLTWRAG
jgi:hypothetical protein